MTTRKTVPKAILEKLMKEYNHRCSICGGNNPHIHHIESRVHE